jgi:hypothetical protein
VGAGVFGAAYFHLSEVMDKREQIASLRRFGYEEREAQFLALAALHSGYFLRRQYCAFLRRSSGSADDSLVKKAIEFRHVKEIDLRFHRKLYSIHAKPLFEALGEIDNRNRRLHEPLTIKGRLMAFDYMLATPNTSWYPTETDRVSLFVEHLGIDKQHLPVRCYPSRSGGLPALRWFVDKPPIFTQSEDKIVRFCFTDPGYHTGDAFRSFLRDYRPLFTRLERSEVIYLTCYSAPSDRAHVIFDRFFSAASAAPVDPIQSDLVEYFTDRLEHETTGLAAFDHDRLNRYRDARRRFANRPNDELFAAWITHGERGLMARICPESRTDLHGRCSLSVRVLDQNYELFGGFPSRKSGGAGRNTAAQVSF